MVFLRFISCIILIINLFLFSIEFNLNNKEDNLENIDYEYQIVRAKRDTITHKAKKGSKTTESPEKEKKKTTKNKKEKNKKKKDKKEKDKKKKDKKKKNKKKKHTKSTKTTTSTFSTTTPVITTTTMNTSSVTRTSTSTTREPPKKISSLGMFFDTLLWQIRLWLGLDKKPNPEEPYYLPQSTSS
uniref:Uncharacterized protein n=1 Tax=Strongyloides venezuelensis TaxID=75913 RepID=A0A0K0FU76_STRVS